MNIFKKVSTVFATVSAITAGTAHADGTVEVLHWWTSGGEARAMAELKNAFEAQGGTWTDSPIAGGGGDAAMTALRARVIAGNSPTAVQLKGPAQTPHSSLGRSLAMGSIIVCVFR